MEQKSKKKSDKIHGRSGAWNINYHLVWTPKRRAPVLKGAIASHLKEIFLRKAAEIGVSIEAMEVMPDHVHLFVSCGPKLSPQQIVKRLKGEASLILKKSYPQLAAIPCLWSSSYYCGTVGQVSESVVKLYIERQKGV
jgi:putative transposase